MNDFEIEGPAAAWVRLDEGPCNGHQLVLLDLVLVLVATRDRPEDKWMIHEYFTGDGPELVANEVAYYRRVDDRSFVFVPGALTVSDVDGHPHWSAVPAPELAAAQ